MALETEIHQFLDSPFPLWETNLTHQLVQHQWKELNSKGFLSFNDYSTARIWLNNPSFKLDKRKNLSENNVCVEMPSSLLQSFYDEHGLELLTEDELEVSKALPKIKKALSILKLIKPVYDCVTDLVRSIHILRQSDAEIDLSYSHPQIPFSIFVSVCENNSTISNLRVAESILHEAMHLKLTLIENIVPLIKPNTNSSYYSPWRDEERPIRGVLHGLFVFKAIYEFYLLILDMYTSTDVVNFISYRLQDIKSEFIELSALKSNAGLLAKGKIAVISLLQ